MDAASNLSTERTMAKKVKEVRAEIPAPVPVITVEPNPFGEITEEQAAGDTLRDSFYLEGYSNKRHERDMEMREAAAARREPKLKSLQHRFQFVGTEPVGRAPAVKELEFRRLGYRPVQFDEAASFGLDLTNSTAKKGPNGEVRVGSQMLMVIDAQAAARHFKAQQEATEKLATMTEGRLEEAADNYNARYGLSKEAGTKFEIEETIEVRHERR